MKNIGEIKNILKGDTQIVSDLLMEEMQALAAEMKFEEAQKIKEKYDLIETIVPRAKSLIPSFIMWMRSPLKWKKIQPISTICISQTDASTKPSPSKYKKRTERNRKKNFYNWALLRCVNDIRALPAKSSYLLNWIWR